MRILFGLAAGAAIAFVDNFAFGGEITPQVIVILLLAASGFAGWKWGRRAWLAAGLAWLCLPMSHLIKHVFGWADTIYPNTYDSILKLAAFSFVVSLLGMGLGMVTHTSKPKDRQVT